MVDIFSKINLKTNNFKFLRHLFIQEKPQRKELLLQNMDLYLELFILLFSFGKK